MKNILLLFATLVLASCSEEVHDHEESNGPSNIKREKVNFKEFSENENAFAVYKNLKSTSSKTQSNSKTVNLDSLDFEVNFNNGLHLSYANLESYTFPIRRTFNNGLLENLVINEHTDGKYYAKLLKYNLTAQERINLSNGVLLGLQNPIITEELGEYEFENQIQSTGCGSITITVITACANGHTIRSQCNLTGSAAPQIKTITIAIDCNDSPNGGGGDGSAGYYGNPFNNGGSSAGGGGSGGSGYITPSFPNNLTPTDLYQNGISEPVLDIGYENKPIDVFFANLTYEQQQWVYVQSEVTKQRIKDYLAANSYSVGSEKFIEDVIDLSIDLDMDVMEVWIDKYDQFINGMSVSEKAIYDDLFITRKLSYIAAAYKANDKANELYPNSLYNGKGDAYRHTLWNALTTLLIGSDFLTN
ncbi:hypothetical protein [Flavobacterium sp.]|uniref:DUF6973 domain-containing protein n=1 Tax=Flavobacterium sp. TaxID=239 RepID=UPI0033429A55